MAKSWKQFKDEISQMLWPSGQAANLVAAHDKFFVDAMIDIQTFVPCAQQDNTNLFPQCSTFYNCGVTVIDSAPRGIIKKVSIVDKINPATRQEDPAVDLDWCTEIAYIEVDYCHVHAFLDYSARCGSCGSIPLFFGLNPANCAKAYFPVPTDAGLPPGLPKLPLGYHYPQLSTDRSHGRAGMGIWSKNRGKIYIAPWIQSTETAAVMWDGLKRDYQDSDLIDDDPLLAEAVREFVRWKHADIYDHDPEEAARALAAYVGNPAAGIIGAREKLIHQCREETRVRECEPSHARQATVTSLFFNDAQSAVASCADGFDGSPVTVNIPAGTVGSAISKSDANQRAKDQAQSQANSQLVCTATKPTFTNDEQTATGSCQGEEGAPPPEGSSVTATVPAGTVSSTISKDDANAQALAQAQAAANAQLQCTFWNAAQSYTATCPAGTTGSSVTKTIAAHTYSSTLSQSDADAQALNAAKLAAESAITCVGSGGNTFYNTQQQANVSLQCSSPGQIGGDGEPLPPGSPCFVLVTVIVAAHTFSAIGSQSAANQNALNYAQLLAQQRASVYCRLGQCGSYTINIP